MLFLLYTIHVIVCIFLILVILLQQGSGADLSVFGGGGTQTAFGARGATQVIHKLTVWGFVGFIVLTFGIAMLQGSKNSSSVMSGVDDAATEEVAGEAAETAPASTSDTSDSASEAPMAEEPAPMEDAGTTSEAAGDGDPSDDSESDSGS